MKSETQIKHKLSQVRFRHLKREIRNGLSRRSENCKSNGTVDLPIYGQVGICLHGASERSSWNGGICDDVASGERAAQCPLFECQNSKDQLREEFDAFLRSSDRAHVAARYPDMAALLWVLDLDTPDLVSLDEGGKGEEPPSEPQPEAEIPPPLEVPHAQVQEVPDLLSKQEVSPVPVTVWASFLAWVAIIWSRLVGSRG